MLGSKQNFTKDFSLRVFSSGCYFIDPVTGEWSSYGVEVLEDTNLTHTHCISTHLTEFAGGFVVLSTAIDFNSVFANASFDKNPTIYITVIIIGCLYILSAILARFYDVKDRLKRKIHLLKDNARDNSYLYELIVFTGSRKGSSTNSNVRIF